MRTPRKITVLALICVCAAALFMGALTWRGAASAPVPAGVFAAAGAACFAAAAVLGYGEERERPARTKRTKSAGSGEAPAPSPEMPRSAPEPEPVMARRTSGGGTQMLFNDGVYAGGSGVFGGAGRGLRLSWDGGCAEILDFPANIGRSPSCPAVINAPSVSRRHACFIFEDGAFYISDLGSANGTFVNGERVGGRALLSGNCAISLGSVAVYVDVI
jgi:hypothetical protein